MSGDSSGNIIVWGRGTNTIHKLVRGVHAGPVFSIACLKDGSIASGGGKDGRIVMFDADVNSTGQDSVVSIMQYQSCPEKEIYGKSPLFAQSCDK